MDYTRTLNRLEPAPDGESALRHRSAVVTAINSDGTVDIDLSGVAVVGVSSLVFAGIGEVVQVVAWKGDLLVIGLPRTSQEPMPSQLTDRATSSGGTAIGTVQTNILQASIDIPADWNTYDVEASVSCSLVDTSGATTGTTLITSKVVHQGGDFDTGVITQELEAQNNHDNHGFSHVAYSEGRTATGTRLFTWQIIRAAVNATNANNPAMICKALRVT
jgi:hypothetical protein